MGISICHREEWVLLPRWLKAVILEHCVDSYRDPSNNPIMIEVRKRVQGFETDLIVTCKSGMKTVRIGFELKENDLYKAISQAMTRRGLFHYFYVVMNLRVHVILTVLKGHQYTEEALSHGIGFVSSMDDCIVIKSYSKAHWHESRSYTYTILAYLGNNEGDHNG